MPYHITHTRYTTEPRTSPNHDALTHPTTPHAYHYHSSTLHTHCYGVHTHILCVHTSSYSTQPVCEGDWYVLFYWCRARCVSLHPCILQGDSSHWFVLLLIKHYER